MARTQAIILTAFVLGLTCMLAGVSSQDTTFPYCDCVRPKGVGTGPYLLTPTTTTENPDGTAKVCWALTTNAQATGSCSRFDLRKIELDINLQCRGAARSITFGNQTIAPSYTSYPDVNGMSFKITRGSGDLASFQSLANKTTPVCIVLSKDEKCNSLPKFCRNGTCDYAFFSPDLKCCPGQNFTNPSSPPPPPPVSVDPFPYCACDTSPPFNSFSLSPSNTAPTPTRNADGLNTYCWDLSANRYTGNATQCVNYDLKKIEFDINTECQNAVQTVTLDGQKVSPSYARYSNFNALVFKVTRGTSPIATLSDLVAAPQRLCITLRSFCPTLQSLCATPFCRIAYFSPSNKCCPLQSLVNAA